MPRILKQLIYGLIYLIFFGLIGWFVYLGATPSVDCHNGAKDRGEQGVDCGPACGNVCLRADIAPVEPMGAPLLFRNTIVSALERVRNTNSDLAAKKIDFHFTYFAGDMAVATRTGSAYVFAEEIKYIPDFWDASRVNDVTRVEFGIDDAQWVPEGQFPKPDVTVADKEVGTDMTGLVVNGRVMNQDASPIEDTMVLALFYNTNGNITGISKTELGRLEAGTDKSFGIMHPMLDGVDLDSTQLYISAHTP